MKPQTWTEEHSAAIRHAAPAIPAADVDELDRVWARVSAGISGSVSGGVCKSCAAAEAASAANGV